MANQTVTLNVSDEMKLDDVRQELCSLGCDEELYSSSVPDTCGDGLFTLKEIAILCELEGIFRGNISTK